MKEILQKEAPALRAIAEKVPPEKAASPNVKKIILEMKHALHAEEDGVAIAAPQLGYALRIFIVSGRVFAKKMGDEKWKENSARYPDCVFINPRITKRSKKTKLMEEGCLSVRWLYGKVQRSEKATVAALDERGTSFTRGASGLLAQIFQHETDHLDGILFTDKAKNLHELPPPRHD